MPYDLYGQYYSSARDAENAELAQMAEINSRYALKQAERNQTRNEQVYSQYLERFHYDILDLEYKVQQLERRLKPKRIIISQSRY